MKKNWWVGRPPGIAARRAHVFFFTDTFITRVRRDHVATGMRITVIGLVATLAALALYSFSGVTLGRVADTGEHHWGLASDGTHACPATGYECAVTPDAASVHALWSNPFVLRNLKGMCSQDSVAMSTIGVTSSVIKFVPDTFVVLHPGTFQVESKEPEDIPNLLPMTYSFGLPALYQNASMLESANRRVETRLVGDPVHIEQDPYRPFHAPSDRVSSFRYHIDAPGAPRLKLADNKVNVLPKVDTAGNNYLEIIGFPLFMDATPRPCRLSFTSFGPAVPKLSKRYRHWPPTLRRCKRGDNLAQSGVGRLAVVDQNPALLYNVDDSTEPCPFYCPDLGNASNYVQGGANVMQWDLASCLVPVGYNPARHMDPNGTQCKSKTQQGQDVWGQQFPVAVSTYQDSALYDIASLDCGQVCSLLNRRSSDHNSCVRVSRRGNCICGPVFEPNVRINALSTKYTQSLSWPERNHACETGDNLAESGDVDANPSHWKSRDAGGELCPFYCPDFSAEANVNYTGTERQLWSLLSCLVAVGYDPQDSVDNATCKRNTGQRDVYYGQRFPVPVTYHRFADIDNIQCGQVCSDIGRMHTAHNYCKEGSSKYGNCFCGPRYAEALQLQVEVTAQAQAKTVTDGAAWFATFNQSFARCHGDGVTYDHPRRAPNDQRCVVASSRSSERQYVACDEHRELIQLSANATDAPRILVSRSGVTSSWSRDAERHGAGGCVSPEGYHRGHRMEQQQCGLSCCKV